MQSCTKFNYKKKLVYLSVEIIEMDVVIWYLHFKFNSFL